MPFNGVPSALNARTALFTISARVSTMLLDCLCDKPIHLCRVFLNNITFDFDLLFLAFLNIIVYLLITLDERLDPADDVSIFFC